MDALAERLDSKLREWQPEAADIARSASRKSSMQPIRALRTSCALRRVEQDVLDLIDDESR